MHLSRIFTTVGIVAGAAFVLINAGRLPAPWAVVCLLVGLALALIALWRGVLHPPQDPEPWTGSATPYWIAVAAEVVAIPAGAALLGRVLGQPDLVVLWVVFVVGAHFLPARAFGVGRFAELGVVLMLIAVLDAAVFLGTSSGWVPALGAVLAGFALLGFAASRIRTYPL